jgi:peptidoglycan biosynthesis protein MviN/MurJ (putative lipid II flippase)
MKKQLAVITVLTAASQVSAFFKLWFTARIFGVGSELDGYNLALGLPTLLSGVVAGFLQTGLFPVRAKLKVAGNPGDVDAFERAVLWGITSAGVVFTVLLSLGSPAIIPALAGRAPATVIAAMGAAFPYLTMLVALNMVGDCAGYLLAMRNRFSIAAAAPIANGIIGGLLLAAWPEGGLTNLILGTVLGLAVQVGICLWGLRSTGLRLSGPFPALERMRSLTLEMLSLGAWILPGVVLSNLTASLPPIWVASFGEGANSAFGYAYRLHSSVVQLLIMASSPVILTHFADLVANNEIAAVRVFLGKAAAASAIIGVVATVLVGLIGAPMLGLIFSGRFDAEAASRVAHHWWWMTTGLAFLILGNVFAKLWQSQQRPRQLSIMAGAGLIALVATFSLLRGLLLEYSVAAAMSASAVAIVVLGIPYLRVGAQIFTQKDKSSDVVSRRKETRS